MSELQNEIIDKDNNATEQPEHQQQQEQQQESFQVNIVKGQKTFVHDNQLYIFSKVEPKFQRTQTVIFKSNEQEYVVVNVKVNTTTAESVYDIIHRSINPEVSVEEDALWTVAEYDLFKKQEGNKEIAEVLEPAVDTEKEELKKTVSALEKKNRVLSNKVFGIGLEYEDMELQLNAKEKECEELKTKYSETQSSLLKYSGELNETVALTNRQVAQITVLKQELESLKKEN
jgi:hypothetical protein